MQTKQNLIKLFNVLTNAATFGSPIFKYKVLKNLKVIDNEIEILKAIEKEMEEGIKDFAEAKNAFIMKYGTPDSDKDGMYIIKPTDPDFETVVSEIKKLEEEHKDSLSQYVHKVQEYNLLLAEDFEPDFEFIEIDIELIPNEVEDIKTLMDFNIIK